MEPTLSMEQQFLKKLTEIIDANLHKEEFGVSELAAQLGMSRVTLNRKVKSVIKKSVSEFLRETRLKKAYELLQQRTGTVSEISYTVGFGSVSYFNRCFHKFYGYPPGEVLKGLHEPVEPNSNKKSFRTAVQTSKILYVLPIVIVLVTFAFVLFQNKQSNTIEKTIAVLPPVDNSPDENMSYILEGFKEEVQVKLNAIKDLKITSSTTTEIYRNSNKPLSEIRKNLRVNYVIEISGQTIGNKTSIRVQLIDAATDKQVWSKTYVREINHENIYEIQQEVALTVAKKINANITADEKQMIGKRPTENMAAYNCYLQGTNYLSLYRRERNASHWKLAKTEFENAVELDSTYTDAWLALANIYISHLPWENMEVTYENYQVKNNVLDSALLFINKASKYADSDYSELLVAKSNFYKVTGDFAKSMELKEQYWRDREKDFIYYLNIANQYHWKGDYYNNIKYMFTSLDLTPETEIPRSDMLFKLMNSLAYAGFPKTAGKYVNEYYKITNDSNNYHNILRGIEFNSGNFEVYKNYIEERFTENSSNIYIALSLMTVQLLLNDEDGALLTLSKTMNLFDKPLSKPRYDLMISYLFSLNGMKKEAQPFINEALKAEKIVEELYIATMHQPRIYFNLAAAFAFTGQDEKALEMLSRIAQRETVPLYVILYVNHLPYFKNLKEHPEYKKIIGEMEAKYLEQHEKIKKLLISRGMEPE